MILFPYIKYAALFFVKPSVIITHSKIKYLTFS